MSAEVQVLSVTGEHWDIMAGSQLAYTHTCKHKSMHVYVRACTHTHTHSCAHTHTHTPVSEGVLFTLNVMLPQ